MTEIEVPEGERVTKNFVFVTGYDARFPNQNQTKHCWQNYVDYGKCTLARGEDFAPCRQVYLTQSKGPKYYVKLTSSSFFMHTDHYAHLPGLRDGMSSVKMAHSLFVSMSNKTQNWLEWNIQIQLSRLRGLCFIVHRNLT
ncbi:hypothetical protein GcM1_244099 [Golovinomyces cichoracearum]|uniref:Cytochrome c oxidase subunit 6B n=1 Tax=Golovinomyces cichoracearum TaxID=62708 RepID=A0A420IFW5_9PEZI|nr:hypothetical protein GcM1_244099 [Golovinomyces cichoracearum]